MTWNEYLEHSRALNPEGKKRLAFTLAAVGTGLIGIIWLTTTFLYQPEPVAKVEELPSPLTSVATAVSANVDSIQNVWTVIKENVVSIINN